MKKCTKLIVLSFIVSLMLVMCNNFVQAKENKYLEDPGYVKYMKQKEKANSVYGRYHLAETSNASLNYSNAYENQEKYDAIDVSEYQGNINWNLVKSSGIEFAIIRVGGRYYGSGGLYTDTNYLKNLRGAKDAGLKVGAYFYSNAINITEAIAEANYAVSRVKETGVELDMPIFMDYEGSGGIDNGRFESSNIGPELGTNICKSFCNTVLNNGYDAGIYSGCYFLAAHGKPTELAKLYKMWYANYNSNALFDNNLTYPVDIWQYSASGYVSGISNQVDRNIVFIKKPDNVKNLKFEITQEDKKTAKISWDKVTNATNYRVAIFINEEKVIHKAYTSTSVKVRFEAEGTAYAKVCAVNEKFGMEVRSSYISTKKQEIKYHDSPNPTQVTPTPTPTPTTAPKKEFPNGDVNNDGKVSLFDVLKLRRYIAMIKTGKNKSTWNLTTVEKKYADANNDGTINLKDVLQLRRIIARKK